MQTKFDARIEDPVSSWISAESLPVAGVVVLIVYLLSACGSSFLLA